MTVKDHELSIPLTGAKWAARSETYASLIAEHLCRETKWLAVGCGSRLLEEDMDPVEDWLVQHCGEITGMDVYVTPNRNIRTVVQGSLYELPFDDRSFDLVTCNMVVE